MQKAAWHDKGGHEIKNKLKKVIAANRRAGSSKLTRRFFEPESVSYLLPVRIMGCNIQVQKV